MPKRRTVTEEIPPHLQPYISGQDPSLYTPIDHASWRFILRVSRAFFARHAHQKYVDGLRETGISTERIPLIEEMDQCLRRFGWRAVAVSGFIPPAVFMEFQSLGILPIACEMRTLDHLAYTPAPDIVHEAAGHAPIIADPEYAAYLRAYGEVARKAIFSHKDMAVYEAILNLSVTKEEPSSTPGQIDAAQARLDAAVASVDYVSEATYLARMNWWTVEYGLVGDRHSPKIYGAGLLSSVGESYNCLREAVQKLRFSIDCVNTSYDITRPQPQLFVAPDFGALTQALEEFAESMAFRKGGAVGLNKALQAGTVVTCQLDSGVQVSGVLADFIEHRADKPCFLRFRGPVQLAHGDEELLGQGPAHHPDGFSTPIGRLRGSGQSPAELGAPELEALGFSGRKKGTLAFECGIEVTGVLENRREKEGRNLLLTFSDCTVRRGPEILFQPEWGAYDLACGTRVESVFGGAADRGRYLAATGGFKQKPGKPKTNLTEGNRALNGLYAQVRALRERGEKTPAPAAELDRIHRELEKSHPHDWLLRLELLELARTGGQEPSWESAARARLEKIGASARDKGEMISRGLERL